MEKSHKIIKELLDKSLGFLLVLNYEGGDLAKETEKRRSCTHNEVKLQVVPAGVFL